MRKINPSYKIMALLKKFFGDGMKNFYETFYFNRNPRNYLKAGEHVMLQGELFTSPPLVELESFTRIQPHVRVTAHGGQGVIIKKFSAIGAGCTIIPGAHIPTVGVPQYLSYLAINDENKTVVINEDVWVGTNATLLNKANIGRGAVVGAGSLVTKPVPPYAVVAGSPAKIIAVRFSLEQILEHERILYTEKERLDVTYLEHLFENEYAGLKSIGTSFMNDNERILLNKEKEKLGIENYD